MLIEFEGAVLSEAEERKQPRFNIGWFVQSTAVDSASARYRCFHFARALSDEFTSSYFTSLAEVRRSLGHLDALIVVKRLDRGFVEVVSAAKVFGVPVFLDLCDDLISPTYSKNETGQNLIHFLGTAPLLAGITVPSAEMADRLEKYARDHGLSGLSIHVLPDVAETWEIYRETLRFVADDAAPADLAPPAKSHRKRVVWFGNYGASHSSFGIFSLRPFIKPLRVVNEDIPLELVVISNNEHVYHALVHDCGFHTRYIEWSAQGVYSELLAADAALLTTGDDDFCTIKSSNRVLQALAAGVPVITAKSPALAEFDDVVFSGSVEESLRLTLGARRKQVVGSKLANARKLLERYTPGRIGKIWASLLKRAVQQTGHAQSESPSSRKVLHIIEVGDSPNLAKKMFTVARKLPAGRYQALVSTSLLESQPDFQAILGKAPAIPRFFSGDLKDKRNLLLDASAVVIERASGSIANQVSSLANELGVPVVTTAEALTGALDTLQSKNEPVQAISNTIQPGPYPERTNDDGSVDWCFVVHENARGWILDAICREIGSRQSRSWQVSYYPAMLPSANAYFFSHYLLFENCLRRDPDQFAAAKVFVWYTHPREETAASIAARLLAFDKVTKVIFACESNRQVWIERGLPEEKTAVVLGAADPTLFRGHERGGGVVGLSSSFYERKNPDCLLEIIKLLPHRDFVLLGRKWNQYALFEEMKSLANFSYKSAPYRDYPDIYGTFDVFLSMSTLEGGPIPLVEAMMSNAVPVASRTGFAPDLIRHGENGYIFDLDAPPKKIADLIERAFALKANVRQTVERYDWDHFSAEVTKLAQ